MIEHVQNQVEELQEQQEHNVKDNFVSLPSSSQRKIRAMKIIQGTLKRDDDNDGSINNGNKTGGALKVSM
jgi:hypothetical protein